MPRISSRPETILPASTRPALRRRISLAAAAAVAAASTLLPVLPAHAASTPTPTTPATSPSSSPPSSTPPSSTSGTSSSLSSGQPTTSSSTRTASPSTAPSTAARFDPDAPPPTASHPEDQGALDKLWQRIKDLISGDDHDSDGTGDDSGDGDSDSSNGSSAGHQDSTDEQDQPDPADAPAPTSFVQRDGSTLTLDGAPFRFSGSNIYWLGLDDNVRDNDGNPTQPSRFRIDDAMRAAQASGSTVVRTWGGLLGCDLCIEPKRGQFNDAGFKSLDYAVASAAKHGQRLVITLVDNWDYYNGSKRTFTDWRGKPESAFFSDKQVIADYQDYISHVLDHENPHTGLRYADDPTIMAWETGNEMWCETCANNFWDGSWTKAVADHIKEEAPRQLVIDGHGTDPACTSGCLHEPSLDFASIDMVDDHHYPPVIERVRSSAATAREHGKVLIVGEYAWNGHRGGDDLKDFLAAVEDSGAAGALMWSIVAHSDDEGGFVNHDDGFQFFYPGRTDKERADLETLREFAVAMGAPAPTQAALLAPANVKVEDADGGVGVSWRGAAPATSYTVERSVAGGNFKVVAEDVTDTEVTDGQPLWVDTSTAARDGKEVEYRVVAVDDDEESQPSGAAALD